jgi:uncharacterized protein
MTPQESSMLEDLIRKVRETQLTEKDPEAEQLLQQGLARDPDAIYKLAQTVLVQNLALEQAHAQIQQMQQAQQQPQPARATSFLGGLLGHRDPVPPAPQPQYQPVPYQQAPGYQAPPQYAAVPPYAAPPYAAPAPSPAGSFLRSAATTAAGVAAGALAFEGIQSLFGHGGGGWGGGGWGGGLSSGSPVVDETVVNNYYDDPKQADFAEHHEREASYDDRPEGQAELKDTSYQPDSDTSSLDDSQDASQTDDFDSDSGNGDSSDFV